MQMQSLTPMLWVDNLSTTIDFYTQVLGFSVEGESTEWGWAHLKRDTVEIMFCLPNPHMPYAGPAFTGSLYISTDDAAGWWEKLKEKATVLYPMEDFNYGMREFAIKDCNGYIVQFGQQIGQ